MISSLIYVSTSLLSVADQPDGVFDIIEVSQARNAALGVTGALVLARGHFAQVLEGERAAIDELMLSIQRDQRHTGVNVVDIAPLPERRFAQWSMAYIGQSTYVDRRIAPLLPALQEAQGREAAVSSLIELMQEFTQGMEWEARS